MKYQHLAITVIVIAVAYWAGMKYGAFWQSAG